MTASLIDGEARRRIRAQLDQTFVVEAAAGTGKTTELVSRSIAVLRTGRATMSSLVAVTFTEKAAGEMKLRIREALDRSLAGGGLDPVERARLVAAAGQLELARIGTIHALCAEILRERPIEAGVDPEFRVVAEDESHALLERAFDGWFERALERPGEGLRRFLRRAPGRNPASPRDQLLRACRELLERRDHAAPWRRDPFARDEAIDRLVVDLRALADLRLHARRPDEALAIALRQLSAVVDGIDASEAAAGGRDHDALEGTLCALARDQLWRQGGGNGLFGEELARADVVARRNDVAAQIAGFAATAEADLAACLHAELQPVVDEYAARKARAGGLDFLDMLIRVRDLLIRSRAVRTELQQRITHLFVDEFQDTDPLQVEILMVLAADDPEHTDAALIRPVRGKLFVVGDPKQAIYRFRRADVALYERVKQRVIDCGGEVLTLQTSFRAVPAIQAAVNRAFRIEMRGAADGTQASYVPLQPWRPGADRQPAVIALPAPEPFSHTGRVTKAAARQRLPETIAAFIRWLIESSGWRVSEGAGHAPLASRHICLLFRQLVGFGDDITRPYARALEARRIPHVLVGGRSFHDREEVMAARSAMTAIEWPADELAVYAVLRGPLFGISDDQLLVFRHAAGRLHPLRPVDPASLPGETTDVASALCVLRELHLGRNRRPIADTLAALLAHTRAHAAVAIWPTGEQSLANLLRIMDLARRFETSGARSFRNFVEWFEQQAEREQAPQAPIVEEGTEGVRIMTVHRAKGLEFPVVILCDPFCSRTPRRPSRWTDPAAGLFAFPLAGLVPAELREHAAEVMAADAAEEVRIAYVAATRARDLLVVPAAGEGRLDGWVDVLFPSLYPDPSHRRSPAVAAGCPPFGDDTVRNRPTMAPPTPADAVAPGRYELADGAHVVWWDPHLFELDERAPGGIRQQELFARDGAERAADDSLRAHQAWRARRQAAIARASVPSFPFLTATAAAATAIDVTAAPLVAITDGADRARPAGKRFGTLVHAVLADAPLSADEPTIRALAALHARLFLASDIEVAAAIAAISSALAHPLLQRAAIADARGDCRREVPLALRLDDGTAIEGVCDLAFREPAGSGNRWIVVDYKTDDPRGKPTYARQIDLYARAIASATGEPAEAVLLWV